MILLMIVKLIDVYFMVAMVSSVNSALMSNSSGNYTAL